MPKQAGRKSRFSRQLANSICCRIAAGETLSSICSEIGMPCRSTIYCWLQLDAEFENQYSDARKIQAEALADSIVDIADDAELGRDQLAKAKLRIDARKWLVGRLAAERIAEEVDENVQIVAESTSPQLTVEISGFPQIREKRGKFKS